MSAKKKVEIKKLGIFAGGGAMPRTLLQKCEALDIEPYLVHFPEQTDKETVDMAPNKLEASLGHAGKIIDYFKRNDISDLIMIGHIKRPSFSELKTDLKAVQILSRIGMKALGGDNTLLTALREELEKDGFTLHGIHKFCEDLLAQPKCYTKKKPTAKQLVDIENGIKISHEIGRLDIGQSIIIQHGVVLGVEAAEGTDELIRRCGALQKKGTRGIVIKTCKPQQDRDLDLPTIGLNTLETVKEAGLSGIAIEAHNVIIIDVKKMSEYADKHKLFIIGL